MHKTKTRAPKLYFLSCCFIMVFFSDNDYPCIRKIVISDVRVGGGDRVFKQEGRERASLQSKKNVPLQPLFAI